jgi:hypothetical protein
MVLRLRQGITASTESAPSRLGNEPANDPGYGAISLLK